MLMDDKDVFISVFIGKQDMVTETIEFLDTLLGIISIRG